MVESLKRGSPANEAKASSSVWRHEFVADSTARAIRLDAGQYLTITDVRGGQVATLFLFAPNDCHRSFSPSHTRVTDGHDEIGVGSTLYDNQRSAIAVVAVDTSGAHHSLLPACRGLPLPTADNPSSRTASCQENVRAALTDYDAVPTSLPDPIHLFQAVHTEADGSIRRVDSATAPGDHVSIMALQPLLVIVSSCPAVRRVPISGHGLSLDVTLAIPGQRRRRSGQAPAAATHHR
jgi:uncharacterized protein YcgI (DUF1989 family)